MREIRYPDGTVRHVFAGPEARPWWRRQRAGLAAVVLFVGAVLCARYGGH